MKYITDHKRILVILLISISSLKLFSQELPKKLVEQQQLIEFNFIAGEYTELQETADNLINFYNSLSGEENKLNIAEAYFLKSRAQILLGYSLEEIRESLLHGESILKSYTKDQELHIKLLTELAYSYAELGYANEAEKILESATALPTKDKNTFTLEIEKTNTLIDYQRGYYNKAFEATINLLPKIENEFKDTKLVYDKRKGDYTKVKLSKNEQITQKRVYANQLNFLSEILIEQGDYTTADSIIEITNEWILNLIGKGDIAHVDNLYLKGLVAYKQKDYPTAIHYFEEGFHFLGKEKNGFHYNASSEKYRRLITKLLEVSAILNNEDYINSYINPYQSQIKRIYSETNPFQSNTHLLDIYIRIGRLDFKNAEKYLDKILNSKIQLEGHIKQIEILTVAAEIYLENNKVNEGLTALTTRQKLIHKFYGKNHPIDVLYSLDKASIQAKHEQNFKIPLETFKTYYTNYLADFTPEHYQYIDFNIDYAELLLQHDSYIEAINILEKGIETVQLYYGENSKELGYHHTILGNLCLKWGDISNARKNVVIASKIFKVETNKNTHEAIEYYLLQGKYLTLIGDYDNALISFREVNSHFKDLEKTKKRNQRRSLDQSVFADLYFEKGNNTTIVSSLKSNLQLYENIYGENHRILIEPLSLIIKSTIKNGDYANATKYIQRLQTISKEVYGTQSLAYNNTLFFEAELSAELGNYDDAEKLLKKIIEKQKATYNTTENIYFIEAQTELAMIKLLKGDKSKEVLQLLDNSSVTTLKIFNNQPTPKYAESLKHISTYYIESQDYPKALALINKIDKEVYQALSINSSHEKFAELHFLKAQIYDQQDNFHAALNEFEEAASKYKKSYSDQHPLYVDCLSQMSQVYFAQKNYTKALETLEKTTNYYLLFIDEYFPWLTEHEKNMYWNKIKVDFEFYNSVALQLSSSKPQLIENIYNYNLQTKALLLNSSVKLRRAIDESKDSTLILDFNKWIALREEYTAVLGISDEDLKSNGEHSKEELTHQIKLIEKRLSEKSSEFTSQVISKTNQRPNWQQVQSKLQENECVVNILRFRHFNKHFTDSIIYLAMIINKDSKSPEMVLLPNGNQLESKYIYYYRHSMRLELVDTISYSAFWKPIKNKVKDKSIVYLSNDGIYSQVNIESLYNGTHYAIDENTFVQIMNPRDLINKTTIQYSTPIHTGKAVFVSNPNFYEDNKTGKIQSLPGTSTEVNAIIKSLSYKGWEVTKLSEKEATETNLKKISNPNILHIATHGFFHHDESKHTTSFSSELSQRKATVNPLMKSGLLMNNAGNIVETAEIHNLNEQEGVLTAYETIALNLTKTNMVVLSACETGLGEINIGEGVYGLQRSFIIAGAKIIVMSLFKVSDNTTQELMDNFYTHLVQGKTKREAFALAKIQAREKYPEPIHWGAFVMLGLD